MKSLQISNALRALAVAAILSGSTLVAGCSTDAIMGPDEADGPTVQTSTNPHDPEPGNDDCDVGGC